jgi:uncharacterized membrane protein YoaK (UPF0700 family)
MLMRRVICLLAHSWDTLRGTGVVAAVSAASNRANGELFIVCMCLALGIQNGALEKTNGISVHSTYMTGMVTALMQKSFDHLSPKRILRLFHSDSSYGHSKNREFEKQNTGPIYGQP